MVKAVVNEANDNVTEQKNKKSTNISSVIIISV